MEKEASPFDEQTAEELSLLARLAVARSLDQCRNLFREFQDEINATISGMVEKRPVIAIKVGEGETKQLSSRMAPYLPRLVTNARLGLYSMLVGPAGCGKTTAAHQLAESLGVQFGSVCLTAGASETWLFGRQTPTGFVEGQFSKIYREGGVFLADEMDAADANLLLSINTALSHSSMLNPMNGEVIHKHPSFVFIGAANTNGKGSTHLYTGRSRLDAATLDRMVVIMVDYDAGLEQELCPCGVTYGFLQAVRSALKDSGYDEFVSTRAFSSTYRQIVAGIEPRDVMESLSANWGDAAKKIAKQKFDYAAWSKRAGAPADGGNRKKASKKGALANKYETGITSLLFEPTPFPQDVLKLEIPF